MTFKFRKLNIKYFNTLQSTIGCLKKQTFFNIKLNRSQSLRSDVQCDQANYAAEEGVSTTACFSFLNQSNNEVFDFHCLKVLKQQHLRP